MTNPKWEIGPVKLVDGGDAQIFLFDEFRKVYLGAYRLPGGGLYALEWLKDGRPIDAVAAYTLAPPPKKKVRVQASILVYRDGSTTYYRMHDTPSETAKQNAFAFLELDREVEEGEGL